MREILFRGKTSQGYWHYGYYEINVDGDSVVKNKQHYAIVTPESVQEYTGQEDSNGVKIFEGDWVQVGNEKFCVQYVETCFSLCEGTSGGWCDIVDLWVAIDSSKKVVVVGNEFDERPGS